MNAPGAQDETSPFKKVVTALETPLRKALEGPQQALEEGTQDDFLSVFLPLLADLNAQGSLPASTRLSALHHPVSAADAVVLNQYYSTLIAVSARRSPSAS